MSGRSTPEKTAAESRAFKEKILKLRAGGKSIVEIGHQLGVSKQYVSIVLIEAGQGGKRINSRPTARRSTEESNKQLQATIARLEEQGKYTLAESLREVAERRIAATLRAKRSRKQDS
jgi:hypothetical protein